MNWWRRLRAWWANRPCYTEYWTNGGLIMVPCDAFWAAHEAELAEAREMCRRGYRSNCV